MTKTTTSFLCSSSSSSSIVTSSRHPSISNQAQVLLHILLWLFSSFLFVSQIPSKTATCTVQAFNIDTLRQYLQFPSRFMNKRNKHTNLTIRTQTAPDPCLRGIASIQDIQNKVQQIRALQSTHGDAKLYNRQWLPWYQSLSDDHTNDLFGHSHRQDACNFSVLQFNTLAQGLSSSDKVPTPFIKSAKVCEEASSSKFVYGGFTSLPHPEITLDFDLRKWRIIEVLLENLTDVIAMEEVDRFHGFFQPLLDIMGYDGIFVPKPSSPCIPIGWYSDGCALFWKRGVLELMRQESHSYENGNQVYTIATMKHLETGCVMVLAVTHLKAGKGQEMEKIRLIQIKELRKHIDRMVAVASKENSVQTSNIPVIIMGDFNSDPTENESCIWGIVSSSAKKNVNGSSGDHSNFTSVYPIDQKEMSYFTTWKIRGDKIQKRVIDYIFFNSASGIECSHILSIPKQDQLEESRLPGLKYPSDHLAIGAKFQLRKKSGE